MADIGSDAADQPRASRVLETAGRSSRRPCMAALRLLSVGVALGVCVEIAWAGPGSISGTVRSPNGNGRSGVIVTAIGQQKWARTTSGSGGIYSLAGLAGTSSYLKHVLRQYGPMASDGIHSSGTGNEALAMLYQQAALGSTPGIARTTFAPTVAYPNAVAPNFADYVVRTCN